MVRKEKIKVSINNEMVQNVLKGDLLRSSLRPSGWSSLRSQKYCRILDSYLKLESMEDFVYFKLGKCFKRPLKWLEW